jgi:hypothetical protein
MRASRQPLLLLDHVVTIPEASDCDLYKCKDTFPIFIAARMLYSILQFERSLARVNTAVQHFLIEGSKQSLEIQAMTVLRGMVESRRTA